MSRLRRRDALLAGLRGRCPCCGKGRLFKGFLRTAARCESCGFPLAASESGDGPAVFVIIIVGFIVVFAALFTEIAAQPPIWMDLAVWPPLAAGLCLALLRPAKGVMIALQINNRAGEHRADRRRSEGE
ncbi:MAG: DUF983 domain-containing protein [Caulobacteraceae bacterium]